MARKDAELKAEVHKIHARGRRQSRMFLGLIFVVWLAILGLWPWVGIVLGGIVLLCVLAIQTFVEHYVPSHWK